MSKLDFYFISIFISDLVCHTVSSMQKIKETNSQSFIVYMPNCTDCVSHYKFTVRVKRLILLSSARWETEQNEKYFIFVIFIYQL